MQALPENEDLSSHQLTWNVGLEVQPLVPAPKLPNLTAVSIHSLHGLPIQCQGGPNIYNRQPVTAAISNKYIRLGLI